VADRFERLGAAGMTPVRLAFVSRENRGIELDICRHLARLAARFGRIDRCT
jgi:hypothetical protein